jgi:hypothetical protein
VERQDVEAAIRSAFAGVRLGSGVSLQQARIIDEWGGDLSQAEFDALPQHETTDDWTAISASELVCDALAHLDADGLRYYLPALMLWLLDHHDDQDLEPYPETEMTVIGTISALAPWSDGQDRYWRAYDTFTPGQRAAVARYVEALPRLVRLDAEDAARIAHALDRYWARFLE